MADLRVLIAGGGTSKIGDPSGKDTTRSLLTAEQIDANIATIKTVFARFLAFGITATILIQAFFNVSVVLALVPTKGITLPFISYGGTSLFFTLASVGVLLNLSREID